MSVYDERLEKLQRDAARKRRLESMLGELRAQRSELEARVSELEAIKLQEQEDVERLESGGITALFYSLVGKGEEKMTKERREAAAAALKYESAARELDSVMSDIAGCESELAGLSGCEQEYEETLQAKSREVKASGGAAAAKLLELEARAAACVGRKKEILEAIAAGSEALVTAEEILDDLDSAGSWATWDVFGGGIIADIAKHSHLDEAQYAVERLQSQLRRFKTELADVGGIGADVRVNVDGFLRFADYFFDGIFVDFAVMDHISNSAEQVQAVHARISDVLERLHAMLSRTETELNETRAQADELVRRA